mmetsp:Transcript_1723/g.3987  ORF Transcript_1723/g.3987 Transcript_1723/m.3987 type:complete len:84 (-) Transcript_1723:24-275(-)
MEVRILQTRSDGVKRSCQALLLEKWISPHQVWVQNAYWVLLAMGTLAEGPGNVLPMRRHPVTESMLNRGSAQGQLAELYFMIV